MNLEKRSGQKLSFSVKHFVKSENKSNICTEGTLLQGSAQAIGQGKALLLKGMQRKGGQNHQDSDPNLRSLNSPLQGQNGSRVRPNTAWVICLNQRTRNWAWELFHFVLQSGYKQRYFYYLLNNFLFQTPFVNQVGYTEHTQRSVKENSLMWSWLASNPTHTAYFLRIFCSLNTWNSMGKKRQTGW